MPVSKVAEYYYQTGVIDGYRTAAKTIAEAKLLPAEMVQLFTELADEMEQANEFLRITLETGVESDATH